jgi:predicted dinucleotide-binding enzyme
MMKFGILGTGMVGEALATKLAANGHEVMMGSRDAANPKAKAWAAKAGAKACTGSFAEAARFGEVLFNCTSGMASLQALKSAGADALASKVLVDVANPLDFSKGMPPSLSVCNTDSLGEQIQREFPKARVVKALNTLAASLMVDPTGVAGDHSLFLAGNDAGAKSEVSRLLTDDFGWKPVNLIDVGDITAARGTEGLLLLWIRLYGKFGSANFNFHVVRG